MIFFFFNPSTSTTSIDKLGKTRTEKRKKELFNSKRKKTRKKAILAKQKEITERKLCKTRNVVSKSDASTKQKFQDLKDSIDKYNPISEQTFFMNPNQHNIIKKLNAE